MAGFAVDLEAPQNKQRVHAHGKEEHKQKIVFKRILESTRSPYVNRNKKYVQKIDLNLVLDLNELFLDRGGWYRVSPHDFKVQA